MTALRLIAAALAASSLASACSPAAPKGDAPASAKMTPAAATPAAPDATPRGFVDDLYGQYRKDETFSPFTQPERWFDPVLLAAIKENDALTPEGEVGAIDSDPICNCQDSSGLQARVDGVDQTSPTTATARVDLWAGTPDQRRLELRLVAVDGKWRVRDALETGESEGNHSFLIYVQEANAAAKTAGN